MFVLRACGAKEGFYVGFYFGNESEHSSGWVVEQFVTGNAGGTELGRSEYDSRIFAFEVVVECGESGNFEVVFVGGVEWIAGEDFDEFFEVIEAAVVAHLGSGNLAGFGRNGFDGSVGIGS